MSGLSELLSRDVYLTRMGWIQNKLEQLGRRVGATMVEQMTRDIPRFKNELDVLVFVCKQFWQQAWHKPVDNLKTNHQVTCVQLMS